jgi:hypothetical protein
VGVSDMQTRLIGFTKLLLSLVAICFRGAFGGVDSQDGALWGTPTSRVRISLGWIALRRVGLQMSMHSVNRPGSYAKKLILWVADGHNRQMFEGTIAGGDSPRALGRPLEDGNVRLKQAHQQRTGMLENTDLY